jgi:hypothetical protein
MAGRQSADCQAKVLILNHISPKCESNLPELVQEAYVGSNKQSSVLVSFDFMEVVIPWMGFGNHDDDDADNDAADEDDEDTPQADKIADRQTKDGSTDKIKTSRLLSWARKLL